jgi:hypothetical protein
MSRERPIEPPRVVPDQQRGVNRAIEGRKQRAREALAVAMAFSGPSFMGGLMAAFSKGAAKVAPRFVRRGYEAGIVDELREFFARRPRPWRPAANAPKPNRKTLQRSLGRRAMHRRQAAA